MNKPNKACPVYVPRPAAKPITMRALVARINRAHARDGLRLCVARGAAQAALLGRYYIIETSGPRKGRAAKTGVKPANLGRMLGVIDEHEVVG